MAQAMVFSVVGRKSEVGYQDDPAAYQRYKNDKTENARQCYVSPAPAAPRRETAMAGGRQSVADTS